MPKPTRPPFTEDKPYRRGLYAPHIPAGVLSIDELRTLLGRMEEAGAETVKLGGETVFVWPEDQNPPGDLCERTGRGNIDFRFGGVRPVKMCSAETFCRRFQQPVLELAQRIDDLWFGQEVVTKITIGVAGCQRSCSEPATKDIGVIATPKGYDILIGGNAGLRPRLAQKVFTLSTADEVVALIGRIITYVNEHSEKMERIGAILERKGRDSFIAAVRE